MFDEETTPADLSRRASDSRRRFRFDPTVSMGTLIMALEILIGFIGGGMIFSAERERTHLEILQLQKDQLELKASLKEAIGGRLDKMQDTLTVLGTDMAVLKARREPK